MICIFLALFLGPAEGTSSAMPMPGPELWMNSAAATPYWDLHGEGVIDVVDLLYFGDVWFEDVTDAAGIVATQGALNDFFATGQAWGDCDNDGLPDLYLTNSIGANTLYHNNGNGTFSVSPLSGQVALARTASSGTVWVDFDNDGWLDLYVLNDGPNSLFRNMAGAGFLDVTASSGTGNDKRGMSAAWGDINGDSFLDLYVVNWGEPGQKEDGLYLANGDGTFTDLSAMLGASGEGPGCTASFLDFDNDRDLDLYVVNDKLYGNILMRNDGPGCGSWCLTDVSALAGANTRVWGMGLAVGDYDGDLDLDLYFSHVGPMVLLRNQSAQGSPSFLSAGSAAGVGFDTVGWGAIFFDFDNDGWLDLYLATSVYDITQANRLFHNRGDGTFADRSLKGGTANLGHTLGAAYADYDQDGLLDLVIGNRGEGYRLYHNRGTAAGAKDWLDIRLTGSGPINRNAIGTRVYLTLADGRTLMQEVKCGSSLGSGNDFALHFGLGTSAVVQASVLWPDGTMHAFGAMAPNYFISVAYPDILAVMKR